MGAVVGHRDKDAAAPSAAAVARLAHQAELERICADLRRMILAAEPAAMRPAPLAANAP